jgi:hypothetical protein
VASRNNPLDRLEGLIGTLASGGWVLPSHRLHPLEMAGALLRVMEEQAVDLVDTQTVPNLYAVRLNDQDYQRFEPVRGQLTDELERYLTRMASQRGYRLAGRVRVKLEAAPMLRTGQPEIVSRFEQPRGGSTPNDDLSHRGGAQGTSRFQAAQRAQATGARLEIGGRSHPVSRFPFVLGRGDQVDLQLLDPRVSRRHAEINRFGAEYRIQDLGSRNGTRLNGQRVEIARLAAGDRISLGGLEVVFRV